MTMIDFGVHAARWILILFSVVSVGVMLERFVSLRRIQRLEEDDYRALRDMLSQGQEEALRASAAASSAPSAMALQAGLQLREANPEFIQDTIAQEIEVQCAELQGQLPLLATVASTAPYIGLFGTVLGILMAFDHIAKTGQTGAAVVAAPIAEALTATALGLGVAIPAVMAYNYFSGRVNALSLRVETHALELSGRLLLLRTGADLGEA